MTKPKPPMPTCDLCGKEATGETTYAFKIYQQNENWNLSVSADNYADCCHVCFLNLCQNGYIPEWTKREKKDGKWSTLAKEDPQEKIEA